MKHLSKSPELAKAKAARSGTVSLALDPSYHCLFFFRNGHIFDPTLFYKFCNLQFKNLLVNFFGALWSTKLGGWFVLCLSTFSENPLIASLSIAILLFQAASQFVFAITDGFKTKSFISWLFLAHYPYHLCHHSPSDWDLTSRGWNVFWKCLVYAT